MKSLTKKFMSNAVDLSFMKKFINLLMVNGKKNLAYKIFFQGGHQFLFSLSVTRKIPRHSTKAVAVQQGPLRGEDILHWGNTHQFLFYLHTAVKNVQPLLECKKCKIAGTSRLIPAVVSEKRGNTLAVRWIIESARIKRSRTNNSFSQCLAQQLLDAYNKQGRPRQQRDEFHKLAQGNRGYLRYRWW